MRERIHASFGKFRGLLFCVLRPCRQSASCAWVNLTVKLISIRFEYDGFEQRVLTSATTTLGPKSHRTVNTRSTHSIAASALSRLRFRVEHCAATLRRRDNHDDGASCNTNTNPKLELNWNVDKAPGNCTFRREVIQHHDRSQHYLVLSRSRSITRFTDNRQSICSLEVGNPGRFRTRTCALQNCLA